MAKEREKVFVDLGNAMVRAQELLIVLTFTHQTRKAKAKEKPKEKANEKHHQQLKIKNQMQERR